MSKIVTFEQAKRLKELGFNQKCSKHYSLDGILHNSKQLLTHKSLRSGGCLAPTIPDALDFIREEKGIECGVYPVVKEVKDQEKPISIFYEYCFIDYKRDSDSGINNLTSRIAIYPTHTEAQSALLTEALEYLEKGGENV